MTDPVTLRPADQCCYDIVSLGEVMLRLDQVSVASVPLGPSTPGRAAASTTSAAACPASSANTPPSLPASSTTRLGALSVTSSLLAVSTTSSSPGCL